MVRLLVLMILQAPAFGMTRPVGVGTLLGNSNSRDELALITEEHHPFSTTRLSNGLRRYGHSQARLEIGSGIGITLAAMSGFSVASARKGHWLSPHLGIEPFNTRLSVNTNPDREDYYHWWPMASAGMHFAISGCRILPVTRGGGSYGNLGQPGIAPRGGVAFGIGTYLSCGSFQFAMDWVRSHPAGTTHDLGVADLSWNPAAHWEFGLRMETHGAAAAQESVPFEKRMMVIVRGNPIRP